MSEHSPEPVADREILARFVFSPIHIDKKTGGMKPSVFSHVHSKGCSIQRDSIAESSEILVFLDKFLSQRNDRVWIGVLLGRCSDVRGIKVEESGYRAVCVLDTAMASNPSHGELFQTQYIVDEADQAELRRRLFAVFGDGSVVRPEEYRLGTEWKQLAQHHHAE